MAVDCGLPHKFARQNARQKLIDEGLIDRYNEVLDRGPLIKRINSFNDHAKYKYGIKANLVQFEDVNGSNKVVFNDAAFKAIDIIRGVDRNNIHDTATNSYLTQRVSQPDYSPGFDEAMFGFGARANPFEFADDDREAKNIPTAGLTRVVSLKESLLTRAKKAFTDIKPQLEDAKGDPQKYNNLIKLQSELKDYIFGNDSKGIKGLQNEIAEIQKVDSRAPELIAPYIDKELGRLDQLVKSSDPNHTAEARDIIDFVKSMNDFNPVHIAQSPNGHPLYDLSELYDKEGNDLLTPAFKKPFKDWADIATDYEDKLAIQSRNIVEQLFNNNDRVQSLYGKNFSYDDIINSKKGLKDIQWVDMMVMDISSGIFSHNGVMPQVIKNLVDNSFEKHYSWSKEVEEHIDNQLTPLHAELKRLGYTMDRLGFMGVKGYSYDAFRQAMPDENQISGNIAQKYSYLWDEAHGNMEDKFNTRLKAAYQSDADTTTKNLKFREAYNARNKWLRANSEFVDPAKMSQVTEDPRFDSLKDNFTASKEDQDAQEAHLKSIVGNAHYDKIVESQSKKLDDYIVQRKNIEDNLLREQGVNSVDELNDKAQKQIQIWEAQNSPFEGKEYIDSNLPTRIGTNDYHSNFDYNEYVPKRINSDGKDNGFYDKNYEVIENNPILKNFHDLLTNTMEEMHSRFDYDEQQKLSPNSIPNMEKSMIELLLDKNVTFFQALSNVFRRMIDNFKGGFGIRVQDSFNYAKTNPNTGLPDYKVNDTFIKQNSKPIHDLFDVKKAKFQLEWNKLSYKDLEKVSKSTIIKSGDFIGPDKSINDKLAILNKFTGRQYSMEELVKQYGDNIPVGRIIFNQAQHEVAQTRSFDLPKIMKYYSNLTAQYSARKEMLPMVELMREHYEGIKNQVTQNTGDPKVNADTQNNQLNGLRTNANKQFDNWMQRVVLGDNGQKKAYGIIKPSTDLSPEEKQSFLTRMLSSVLAGKNFDGKIYDAQEKKIISQIDDTLGKLGESKADIETAKNLRAIKDNMGKEAALSAGIDSLMSTVKFKLLAFNISSGISNLMEGQMASSIAAATGQYFKPEYLDEVTPTDLIKADLAKQISPSLMPEKVAKAYWFANRMDVLQDHSNELQKASLQSSVSSLSKLAPYYPIMKVEQMLQVPLMTATLKDHEIISSDGTKSSIFDAMQGTYNKDTKQWDFELKPGFDTPENKKSWQDFNGADYYNYKAKTRELIKDVRGDYDPTSGFMAKSSQAGQALMMRKNWLPREFYKRFAVEQDNIHSGIEGFKGSLRSMTGATGAMQGGLVGGFFLGPAGALGGAAIGGFLGNKLGASTSTDFMSDLLTANKILFKKMMGMPVNFLSRTAGFGNLIDTHVSDDYFEKMKSKNFTKQDFNNFRGNMQSMAIQFAMMSMFLIAKSVLWDDKDKPDDPRRMACNLLSNRFMSLAGSTMMYMNPNEVGTTVLEVPMMKFFVNAGKTVSAFDKFMQGEDTITSGANAGRSRLWQNVRSSYIPGVGSSPDLGFGSQMSHQFTPSPIDDYFHNEETKNKEQIKEQKASRRLELEQQLQDSIPDEDARHTYIMKEINKEFPKEKGTHHKLLSGVIQN